MYWALSLGEVGAEISTTSVASGQTKALFTNGQQKDLYVLGDKGTGDVNVTVGMTSNRSQGMSIWR